MQANVGTIPQNAAKIPEGKPKLVKMAGKLAYRNLFHDRLSLVVTLTGIVFSVVLVAVQCGLYIGAERTIAVMVDQSKGDLWVVPLGTKSFDDPTLLIGHEKYAALSTPGVADTEELVVGFANWRKPKGGITSVVLVGSDLKNGTLKPWNSCKVAWQISACRSQLRSTTPISPTSALRNLATRPRLTIHA